MCAAAAAALIRAISRRHRTDRRGADSTASVPERGRSVTGRGLRGDMDVEIMEDPRLEGRQDERATPQGRRPAQRVWES
ncbi:hypothetical protein GCM10017691_46560 [Pseudonocardia petroleophila]